jgi:hypothetical protein
MGRENAQNGRKILVAFEREALREGALTPVMFLCRISLGHRKEAVLTMIPNTKPPVDRMVK